MYEGKSIRLTKRDDGIAVLCFDRQGESVNKFDRQTLEELRAVADQLKATEDLKGLVVTSGKDVFIVGADITEFGASFQKPEEEIAGWSLEANQIFNALEDLPVPSVSAVNGIALDGPSAINRLRTDLAEAPEAVIRFERDGAPQTSTVRTRP